VPEFVLVVVCAFLVEVDVAVFVVVFDAVAAVVFAAVVFAVVVVAAVVFAVVVVAVVVIEVVLLSNGALKIILKILLYFFIFNYSTGI
jgi:hypothetical protein